MGESTTPRGKLRFDRRIRLEFHGATITSDAGLLARRPARYKPDELQVPAGAARASAATKASLGFAPTLGAGRRGPSGLSQPC